MEDKHDASFYLARGIDFVKNAKPVEALGDLSKAIELGGETISEAYLHRGLLFGFMQHNDEMFDDYKMAADYGNESALNFLKESGIDYTPTPRTPPPEKTDTQETPSSSNRFCEQCGAKINDGISFCENCGAKVASTAVSSSSYTPLSSKDLPSFTEENFPNDFTGKARKTFAGGNVYEGDFVDGKIHGKGKNTYPNGNVYEGDFVYNKETNNSLLHGKGKMRYTDGTIDEGNWENGQFAGASKTPPAPQPQRQSSSSSTNNGSAKKGSPVGSVLIGLIAGAVSFIIALILIGAIFGTITSAIVLLGLLAFGVCVGIKAGKVWHNR